MTDELQQLIEAGPSPKHDLQRRVMLRYTDILTARRLARNWQEIAVALGLPGNRHRALAAAFWRVRRGVEAGRLAPAGVKPSRAAQPEKPAQQKAKPEPAQATPREGATGKAFFNSLPQIGGNKS